MPTRLENDLLRNANERLHQWIDDTAMRCEAVGFSPDQISSMLLSCLLDTTLDAIARLRVPREEFLTMMARGYDYKRAKLQRRPQ